MMNQAMENLLLKCEKPARYVGGEYNMPDMQKKCKSRFCMCFPDNYEVAMSNLGIKILYHMLNDHKDYVCERCFAPWPDFGEQLKTRDIELFSLETKKPLKEFDFVGFSFQYELSYTNLLYMLDLAKIPFLASERDESFPIIVGGGPCMCNPLPVADFCDVIVIGEGEEALLKLLEKHQKGMKKAEFFERIKTIEGVYIPSLNENRKIKKTFVKNLDASYFPTKVLLPNIEAVHDRAIVELFRGCTRGCRFCQAGMIYRPVRERSKSVAARLVKESVEETGYDEVSLNSLSTGDYSQLKPLLEDLLDYVRQNRLQLALPSLRLDSFTAKFAENSRKSSLTFAPEAGTQRLRDVINKNISKEDFTKAVQESLSLGYTSLKLYFMIGLPTETEEDLKGMLELCSLAKETAKSLGKGNLKITVSCSTFIPKPFTPFQWCAQDTAEQILSKHRFLAELMKKAKINFNYHDLKTSLLEAVLSRGDKRLSSVIVSAYQKGCKFDGWTEFFDFSKWESALKENGLSIEEFAGARDMDKPLAWDFIDMGVTTDFLKKEFQNALKEKTTPDCRGKCQGCGLMGEGLC